MGHAILNLISISFVFLLTYLEVSQCKDKPPLPFEQKRPGPKYDNPDNIRDRDRGLEAKALKKSNGSSSGVSSGYTARGMHRPSILGDDWNNRFKAKWHPAWMDYCDPYHCNDYHHPACGLNRKLMKFKWFQSGCHITLHNFCSTYKGAYKYDSVAKRHCVKNVMHLRSGCPSACDDDVIDPICGNSGVDNHLVVFKNQCYMTLANCREETLDEYDPVDMSICKYSLAFRHIKLLT